MVIFGGLELVAAGYIIHKHRKNKRERRRLQEEADALDEQQRRQQQQQNTGTEGAMAHRRAHSYDGRGGLQSQRRQQHQQHRQHLQPKYAGGSRDAYNDNDEEDSDSGEERRGRGAKYQSERDRLASSVPPEAYPSSDRRPPDAGPPVHPDRVGSNWEYYSAGEPRRVSFERVSGHGAVGSPRVRGAVPPKADGGGVAAAAMAGVGGEDVSATYDEPPPPYHE